MDSYDINTTWKAEEDLAIDIFVIDIVVNSFQLF